jgi:hypothetical protein
MSVEKFYFWNNILFKKKYNSLKLNIKQFFYSNHDLKVSFFEANLN